MKNAFLFEKTTPNASPDAPPPPKMNTFGHQSASYALPRTLLQLPETSSYGNTVNDGYHAGDKSAAPSLTPAATPLAAVDAISFVPGANSNDPIADWQGQVLEDWKFVRVALEIADNAPPVSLHLEETPDEFFHLYASLEQKASGFQVVGVTSAAVGEGKTTIALHMALSAARSSYQRVCLIDLSLGDDDLCRRIGAAPAPCGLIGLLESDYPLASLVMRGPENMVILPAGKSPRSAARIARSPRLPEFIEAVRSVFDFVVIDLPAVSTGNALPLLAHLDGAVLVAQAGVTPRHVINQAAEQIGRHRVAGVVLNRVSPDKSKR